MPYIKQDDREFYAPILGETFELINKDTTPGDLTDLLCILVNQYTKVKNNLKDEIKNVLLLEVPERIKKSTTPGDLNYLITMMSNQYINANGGLNYTNINNVLGSLAYVSNMVSGTNQGNKVLFELLGAVEGAKLELYRRLAAPYEDLKIRENGDV